MEHISSIQHNPVSNMLELEQITADTVQLVHSEIFSISASIMIKIIFTLLHKKEPDLTKKTTK